ncbi:MAG: hypothetical protein HY787_19045 [Deltaproteobacteria bacterium]|nr:hypothetical protein [Deltaproteobacteria bacterium]
MSIFNENGFEKGKWTGELAKILKRKSIIPDLYPKARIWRATWSQWIQFEDSTLPGPIFWIGKPALLSSKDSLYIGYYVERGFPEEEERDPLYTIGPKWHWNGFLTCLNENKLRNQLSLLLNNLNEKRRCIWIDADNSSKQISYKNDKSLLEAKKYIYSLPSKLRIDLILGVYYSKEECLNLQDKIVSEIVTPLIRAYEIKTLVEQALGRGSTHR